MKIQSIVNIFVGGFTLYNPLLFNGIQNMVYQKYYVGFLQEPDEIVSDNINNLYNIIDQIDITKKINLIGHSAGASIIYKLYSDNLDTNRYNNINSLILCNPVDYHSGYSILTNKKFNDNCYLFDSLNDNDDFLGIETNPAKRDYRVFMKNFQKKNIKLYNKQLKLSHNDIYDKHIAFNIGTSKNNKVNISKYCKDINKVLLSLN